MVALLLGCDGATAERDIAVAPCAPSCAVGCDTPWVEGLLDDRAYPEPPLQLQDGDTLYFHALGGDGAVRCFQVELIGSPIPFGFDYRAGWLQDAGGVSRLALLSPTPRLYCASSAVMPGALGDSANLAQPPTSMAEFTADHGRLPMWGPH